jgi:hypothetical protein
VIIQAWAGFSTATAGAGAALAGLIIVAMSVNIKTILGINGMTARAATTIAGLVLIVVVSCAALIPFQSWPALSLETAVSATAVLLLAARSTWVMMRAADERAAASTARGPSPAGMALRSLLGIVPVALLCAGGVMTGFAARPGLDLIASGILTALAASSTNAWVLLVEILR